MLFFAFAWFELIYPAPDDPARLAWAAGLYWLLSFAAMLAFGYRRLEPAWRIPVGVLRHGGALRIVERKVAAMNGGRLILCWPGAKLLDAAPLPPSGVLFLLLALASVSFDGLSKTFFWLGLFGINPLEFPGPHGADRHQQPRPRADLRPACGGIPACRRRSASGLPAAGIVLRPGGRPAGLVDRADRACLSFRALSDGAAGQRPVCAWSPCPIRSRSAGTCSAPPTCRSSAGVVAGAGSAWCCGICRPASIIAGHVLAVLVAHRLAWRLHLVHAAQAALSQLPLTVLMIAYTVFGLWLLSTPTAG